MAGNHRSGRKPKPDALRVLEGGRKRHPDTPAADTAPPALPAYIEADADALRYWRLYSGHLAAIGLLSSDIGQLLAQLSVTSALYEAEARRIRTPITGPDVVAPGIRDLLDLQAALTRLLGECGLTPVMRTKVARQIAAPKANKWDRLTRRA